MVQGYYTLQEAAQQLGMPVDELKQMAQRNQIRSFQDRGTLRFRIQDIQELGRQRGASSDPELVLGDASLPPKSSAPRSPGKQPPSGPRTPAAPKAPAKAAAPEVFSFDFDDAGVNLGDEMFQDPPKSASRPKSAPPKSGTTPRGGAPRSPLPDAGSDSDVKLIVDDVAGLPLAADSRAKEKDSDVKLPDSAVQPKTGLGSAAKPPARPSKLGGPASPKSAGPAPVDSGVRLVPMDSDSDVKIVGASQDEIPLGDQPEASAGDSNVRLESVHFPPEPQGDSMMLTDEINLDEEIQRQEEQLQKQARQQTRVKPKSELRQPPATSPFELSESDVGSTEGLSDDARPAAPDDSSDFELAADAQQGGSSDFDLVPSDDGMAALPSDASDDDFSLELADDALAEEPGRELAGPRSGISLNNPVDGGISLEESETDDSVDFDLSLEAEEATPRPAQMKAADDSDSEFELSLELDEADAAAQNSDSEFELTLDDSGDLSLEEETPQAKDGGSESDFEIPALAEDEEAATVDTELESSDFDIALDDSELAVEDESASQVVALDEEVADLEESGEFAEIDASEDVAEIDEDAVAEAEEDEEEERVREVVTVVKPAPWGVLPALVMFPTVVVMLLIGLMGFELVQSSAGYRPPGFLSKAVGEMIGMEFPKR